MLGYRGKKINIWEFYVYEVSNVKLIDLDFNEFMYIY